MDSKSTPTTFHFDLMIRALPWLREMQAQQKQVANGIHPTLTYHPREQRRLANINAVIQDIEEALNGNQPKRD